MLVNIGEFSLPESEFATAEAVHSLPVRDKIDALLIDADASDGVTFAHVAGRSKQLDISVSSCRSVDEANTLLSHRHFDVIYVEYWLGEQTSLPFIHENAARHRAPCIVLTDLDEPDIRRLAFRAGAQAFLSKAALGPQAVESVTLAVLRPQLTGVPEPA